MTEASKVRLKFIDIAKGLGMMMIVWMHIWGNKAPTVPPPIRLNGFISSFYVPLFFILSGYLIRLGEFDIKHQIIKKAKSLLRPFIVVYIFSFAVSWLISVIGFEAKHQFLWSNILNVVYSKSFFNGPIWFLLALWWAFLLFYLAAKLCRNNEIAITIIAFIIGIVGFNLNGWGVTLPLFFGQGMVACPLLMAGYLIKKYIAGHLIRRKAFAIASVFIGFFLLRCLGHGLSFQENAYNGMFWEFLLAQAGAAIMVLGFCILSERWLPFVEYWGRYSLVVLCFHNFVLIPTAKVLAKVAHQPIVWSVSTFVIIYLAFLVIIPLVRRFCPSLFNIKAK